MNDAVIMVLEKPVAAAVNSIASDLTTITMGQSAQIASNDRADSRPRPGALTDTKSEVRRPNIREPVSGHA